MIVQSLVIQTVIIVLLLHLFYIITLTNEHCLGSCQKNFEHIPQLGRSRRGLCRAHWVWREISVDNPMSSACLRLIWNHNKLTNHIGFRPFVIIYQYILVHEHLVLVFVTTRESKRTHAHICICWLPFLGLLIQAIALDPSAQLCRLFLYGEHSSVSHQAE